MTSPNPNGIPFVIKLGRALHIYGAPAHRLEGAMTELTRRLGYDGRFFSMPTGIFASIESPDEKRVEMIRIEGSELDLGKLSDLTDVANAVIRGERTFDEGSVDVDLILDAPPRYGAVLTTFAFAVTSPVVSRFFGAGAKEVLISVFAGLAVGLLALAAPKISAVARLFNPLAGFTVSLIAVLGAVAVDGASVPIITVAGLIILIPGLTLTLAVSELAQQNLVSGSARLSGALVSFLLLGFGVAVGGNVGALLTGTVRLAPPVPLPGWTEAVAVLGACITLSVLLRAPMRDFPWVLAACVLTYLGVRQTSPHFGPELGVFVGALIAGMVSNLHARLLDRPAAVTRIPAMMLLVPGGLGFLGLSSLLEQNVMQGMKTAFSVAIIAVALVTGLIISNAIVEPRKSF
jgi:uncharacterized membrane protein YjjP (DUF1212 family)